jgi:hypothetical protein
MLNPKLTLVIFLQRMFFPFEETKYNVSSTAGLTQLSQPNVSTLIALISRLKHCHALSKIQTITVSESCNSDTKNLSSKTSLK